MRVVLDTNVVVSGLLKPAGNERRVLRLALAGRGITTLISSPIITEYEAVLSRPRFKLQPPEITRTLQALRAVADWIEPNVTVTIVKDESDNRFLECAVAGHADYIVTGNVRHFPTQYKGIKIVQARRLLELLAPIHDR